MAFSPPVPPTRILSWQQLVIEADPYWSRNYRQPMNYEFSNSRRFYQFPPVYSVPADTFYWDGPVPWDTPGTSWQA